MDLTYVLKKKKKPNSLSVRDGEYIQFQLHNQFTGF